MRRLVPLVAGVALLAGCGGGGKADGGGGTHTETLPRGAEATNLCLGDHGFGLRPAATGTAAVSPSGAEFTVTFFATEAKADEAAGGSEGSTAVGNAVVTPAGKRLTKQELATVEGCVRGE
jgi:hypothetical protein